MSARAFIILAMVVVVSKVQADAVLRGVVLSNELGGPPMGNVEVSAIVGNPNNTGADGKFTFSFPNKKPGDMVRLIVRKEGYVVVNEIQLELTLPADPEERPMIIVLCKEGDREEMARRFYMLKSVEAIDETYKKKLQDAHNASAAEVAKLRQEREQAKALAEAYQKKLQDAQDASAAERAKLGQELEQAKGSMKHPRRSSKTRRVRVLRNEINSVKNLSKPRRSLKHPRRSSKTRKVRVLQNEINSVKNLSKPTALAEIYQEEAPRRAECECCGTR